MTAEIRRTVRYTGHVQGVNFRRSTARVAMGYGVTGTVRNESDGSVRLVAEGRPSVLDDFLDDVAEVMAGHIAEVDVREGIATGQFQHFAVIR